MSEQIIVIKNKKEIEAKEIYPGVLERTLLKKNESASKKLAVSNIEIKPWGSYGPIDYEGEIMYYVLSGLGNLNYATGHYRARHKKVSDPGPLRASLYDWESNSYAYLSPLQRHGMLNQGEAPLYVLKVEYDSPRELGDTTPWGVQIYKKDLPIRIDKSSRSLSIVNQTPDTLGPIGAKNFKVMEYEIISKVGPRPKPSKVVNPPKPTSETISYIVRGKGIFLVDEKEYPVEAGSIVYTSGIGASLIDVGDSTLDYLMYYIEM
jgi:hypothetical protein